MELKKGDFVRHGARPDWDVGEVLEVTGDKARIRFKERDVTLAISIAEPVLAIVPAEQVEKIRRPTRRSSTGTAAECSACGKPLNRSKRTEDGQWKSCPKCSVEDGMEHVFYRYPDHFGESHARVSGGDPDGAQSYCIACRGRGSVEPTARRGCRSFAGQLAE